ncbi:MAG: gamma-butyrobetaine hydroxylase-like domain-containing protein [Arenicella sp.]
MSKIPTDIQLHQKSKVLEITFDNAERFELPCEYLRVFSPSAEVRGHGPGQEVLQLDKENVNIIAIEPVGQYAVRLIFDDAHDSGLYSWNLLYELGQNRVENWQDYVERLSKAGHKRDKQANDHLLLI